MQLIDTHAHPYDVAFDADRCDVIARAQSAGVEALLLPAIDSSSDEALFAMCRAYPAYCYPLIGLHPTSIDGCRDWRVEIARVKGYLDALPDGITRFYGVGEIGLDYYWNDTYAEAQREAFVSQLRLAATYNLPVVIHTRAAWTDMIALIAEHSQWTQARGLRPRGVFHAFSEDASVAEQLSAYGDFYFGIGGVVTFKRSQVAETVKTLPLDRILLETDCPYLTPAPHRGQRNESAYISLICQKVAALKALSMEVVADVTTANARQLFGLSS
jgi:TatD DNase family protein